MTVIVTDMGFAPSGNGPSYVAWPAANTTALDVPSDIDPVDLADHLSNVTDIRVDFPSFADGRGFTIARHLRRMGFCGRLRARGHVISDQYAMARRAGFDEVEITTDQAKRQPEAEWLFRANWQDNDYQARLKGQA